MCLSSRKSSNSHLVGTPLSRAYTLFNRNMDSVDLCTPPPSPTPDSASAPVLVKEEPRSDPTEPTTRATPTKPRKGLKKRTGKMRTKVKQEQVECFADDSTVVPAGKKRKMSAPTKEHSMTVRTDTNQEAYEEWYGNGDDTWNEEQQEEQWWQEEEDNYPYGLWNLIYNDLQLGEDPEVIHEACVMLQEKQIVHPWHLKQVSREFLEKLFPMEKYPRHLCGVLEVQDRMRKRDTQTELGNVQLTKAVTKLVKEQTKTRRGGKREATSSDSEGTRKSLCTARAWLSTIWATSLKGTPLTYRRSSR